MRNHYLIHYRARSHGPIRREFDVFWCEYLYVVGLVSHFSQWQIDLARMCSLMTIMLFVKCAIACGNGGDARRGNRRKSGPFFWPYLVSPTCCFCRLLVMWAASAIIFIDADLAQLLGTRFIEMSSDDKRTAHCTEHFFCNTGHYVLPTLHS